MAFNWEVKSSSINRIFSAKPTSERLVALSLLDATTANFSFTSALWLLEQPRGGVIGEDGQSSVSRHLCDSFIVTLDSYPWWCGQLKSVTSIDGTVEDEAAAAWHFPRHARRYGRIYAHYGIPCRDPGVEFIVARSSACLDDLCRATRPQENPVWNQDGLPLNQFGPTTKIASALETNEPAVDARLPLMAIQVTELACGGIAVAVKGAHPLADITSLVRFAKDRATISRSASNSSNFPTEIGPVTLNSELLDAKAAGDINADEADEAILRWAESLPLHRYDWWTSPGGPAWATKAPRVFRTEDLAPAGRPLPWSEWDFTAPVSTRIVHFNQTQIDVLWKEATNKGTTLGLPHSGVRISKHDALLAHVWSCIMRARQLEQVLGQAKRPSTKPPDAFARP